METQKVDVPDEVVALLQRSSLATRPLADQVKFALAVVLFQEGIISVGRAAELAGEPRATFELLLGEMGIPPVHYDIEDYEREWRAIEYAHEKRS